MADPGAERPGHRSPSNRAGGESDLIEDLRDILVGRERSRLLALQSRLDDPETRARETGEVLPEALAQRARDPALAKALAPAIEQSIAASVRRNPRPLADALFPIMGPAIRKAIAHALEGMVKSLNQALEHSLSPRAFRWRWTAWRTGKPFSEIVLANTLLYRVEQVFLVHRTSGLLIQHVAAPSVGVQDAGMVSGMLTAIRDFVRDSFGGDEQATLDTLQVGELSVWIEQGPTGVLAAVIRGTAPQELRARLVDAVEAIHLHFAQELESFDGDSASLDAARPILEDCLDTRYHEPSRGPSLAFRWTLAVLLGVPLAAWAGVAVRDQIRWSRYLDRLRAEPGIVVISSSRENGRRVVRGLRDPLAVDPDSLLPVAGLQPGTVDGRWQLYQALEPELIRRRAIEILRPPQTAKLSFASGTLRVSGLAPAQWAQDGRALARLVPGVARYDDSALASSDLARLKAEIEASRLLFVVGSAEFVAGQEEAIAGLRELLVELDRLATASQTSMRLRIVGHTDADGASELNLSLSQARADAVRALVAAESTRVEVLAVGVGSDEPVATDATETKQLNRSVSFRVESVS